LTSADASLRADARTARAAIASGGLRGKALLDRLLSVPPDRRDAWVDALLGIEGPPPEDVPDLPRGCVPYLPCGVEEILAMVADVPLRDDDALVDLGSGLGRVAILGHLLSGARACGVEIQEHLVHAARACAAALALPAVSFLHANATDAELDGSVFFLYAPFNGETLRHVLRRLRHVAARNPIALCAVGVEFRHEDWLLSRASSCAGVTVYESRMPPAGGRGRPSVSGGA
jgi:hypothetical protein